MLVSKEHTQLTSVMVFAFLAPSSLAFPSIDLEHGLQRREERPGRSQGSRKRGPRKEELYRNQQSFQKQGP